MPGTWIEVGREKRVDTNIYMAKSPFPQGIYNTVGKENVDLNSKM